MRQVFGFFMGIMVGVLVGSTVALLLAPEAGESVRVQLRARGQALVSDVKHAAESRRIELTNRLQSLRQAGETEPAAY